MVHRQIVMVGEHIRVRMQRDCRMGFHLPKDQPAILVIEIFAVALRQPSDKLVGILIILNYIRNLLIHFRIQMQVNRMCGFRIVHCLLDDGVQSFVLKRVTVRVVDEEIVGTVGRDLNQHSLRHGLPLGSEIADNAFEAKLFRTDILRLVATISFDLQLDSRTQQLVGNGKRHVLIGLHHGLFPHGKFQLIGFQQLFGQHEIREDIVIVAFAANGDGKQLFGGYRHGSNYLSINVNSQSSPKMTVPAIIDSFRYICTELLLLKYSYSLTQ